ncbi:MAG: GLUG motif-containing protein, partial [Eubacterium sp.]
MKKRIMSIVLAICLVLTLVPTTAFADGDTPQTDTDGVYQIGTTAELYGFAQLVNNGNTDKNTKAVLTADIVVNKDVLKADGTLNTGTFTDWTPIGYWNSTTGHVCYSGTFDGQGHTISGLYFNDANTDYVGLFGDLQSGEIKNVGVVDSYFKGGVNVGGVCAWNFGGKITGCYNTGTVSGNYVVGGVCGYNAEGSKITACYN